MPSRPLSGKLPLELVGVKCRWNRGWRSSHLWISGVLWVA